MKKTLLLAAALVGCTSPSTPLPEPEPEPVTEVNDASASLDPQLCIDHLNDPTLKVDAEPFRIEDSTGIGQFSFTGTVTQREVSAPFSGEIMTAIYLETANNESEAYRYFYNKADGTVDDISENGILFKLGVLNGEDLSSSASMDAETKAAILAALQTGETLTLTMLAAIQLGHGMSAEEVNPCLIQF